jgi:hypothetical protein
MGALVLNVGIEAGGPLLEPGRAAHVIKAWAHDTVKELADDGTRTLRAWPMNKSGRARGNFASALHAKVSGAEARIPGPMITGFTWSPWLEGNSKRNNSTRFKGYRLFRKTAEDLRKKAAGVGERVLRRYIGQIGGQ